MSTTENNPQENEQPVESSEETAEQVDIMAVPVKAESAAGYRWRLIFVGGLALIFAAWFLYDGFVRYPQDIVIYEAHKKMVDEGKQSDWPEYARSQGWNQAAIQSQPGHPHSDSDLLLQRGLGFAILPFGLLFVVGGLRTFGRYIAYDPEQGLVLNNGKVIPLDSVKELDKSRWQKKGIVIVHHESGRLILDDWKYGEEETEQILRVLEKHLGIEPPVEGDEGATDSTETADATSDEAETKQS